VGHAGLLVLLLLIAATVLVPNYTLAWVRSEIPWLSHLISRIEMLWPGVDTVHVLFFAVLGLIARLALPHARLSVLFLAALLFSMVTELLQFYVPGRTPLVDDVRDNMLGMLLGLLAGSVLRWLWRRVSGTVR
jgi:glycopeptide antibiotics resistance protein